jgi:perosamine synthetase
MTTVPLPTAPPGAATDAIPLCVPEIGGNEWRYVRECLDTGWVSSAGAFVDRFEREVAERARTAHAVATVNGTSALHIALLLAGVAPDDEVVVSSLTFIAPANAIRYVGAWPVFMDAEPHYLQMDTTALADFLERGCEWHDGVLRNRQTGRRVRAIVPVHILGHPVDMDPVMALAHRFGLKVVEDATESLGATYRDRAVGGIGDLGCFSFNGNKLLTTGGGGMLVTNDPALAARARYLTTQAKDDAIEYVHGEVGFNYRLTNIQAAMGSAQMERIDEFLAAKRRIAHRYTEAFGAVGGLQVMQEAAWASSAWWMYTIQLDETRCGIGSRALIAALEAKRIQSRPLWQPVNRSPAHASAQRAECPVAEMLNRTALSLPCSVGLTEAMQDRVIAGVLSLVTKEPR